MEIIKFELRKITSSWVVYGLVILFIVFNGFLIFLNHQSQFSGENYLLHLQSFIFNTILRMKAIQLSILTVLITAFLLGFEFEARSYLMVYSTKVGRRLQLQKLKAAIISTTLINIVVSLFTSLFLFTFYHDSELWDTSMNGFFETGERIFFLEVNFWQHSLLLLIIIWLCQYLFVGLVFTLSIFSPSSYFLVIAFSLVAGSCHLLTVSYLQLSALRFTPFELLRNLASSFMISNPSKYYELVSLMSWGLGVFICSILSYRKFKKENL